MLQFDHICTFRNLCRNSGKNAKNSERFDFFGPELFYSSLFKLILEQKLFSDVPLNVKKFPRLVVASFWNIQFSNQAFIPISVIFSIQMLILYRFYLFLPINPKNTILTKKWRKKITKQYFSAPFCMEPTHCDRGVLVNIFATNRLFLERYSRATVVF